MTLRRFLGAFWLLLGVTQGAVEPGVDTPAAPDRVVIIPIRDQIAEPVLYILRRGLKQAIDDGVDLVVLDMKTPGGAVDVTLEIMEALDKFPGTKVTYVNDEAISAGAIIASVTDEIYFAPKGIMGAAEVVFGTGQDVGESMKRKLNSYLSAKIAALSEGRPTRSAVLRAMMDPDYELKIGDQVIKPEGELLTLTASRATEMHGDPPRPLLASGIADDVEALLRQLRPGTEFALTRLEVTWSEKLAQYLTSLSPLLLAAGMVCLFIEFKTPGFGIFGVSGGLLLAIVFFGHYIAGFSGHEPVLLFAVGLLLVALEIFVFPGTLILAAAGVLALLASLVWSMADLWPNEPVTFSGDVFLRPLASVGAGLLLAVLILLALIRFLPRRWIWDRMVLQAAVTGIAQEAGTRPEEPQGLESLVGRHGIAVTALFPSGQIEIDGRRYEARLPVGLAERGTRVVVTGQTEFGLAVEVSGE